MSEHESTVASRQRQPKPTEGTGGLDNETFAWWRAFVKPIVEVMEHRSIAKLTITRTADGRVRFCLDPEKK